MKIDYKLQKKFKIKKYSKKHIFSFKKFLDQIFDYFDSETQNSICYTTTQSQENNQYIFIICLFLILLTIMISITWFHIHITELKYIIAKEIKIKENLMEENNKLKVEVSMLKTPDRIEKIVRNQLKMTNPCLDQIININ